MRVTAILATAVLLVGVLRAAEITGLSGKYNHAPAGGEAVVVAEAINLAVREVSMVVRPIARPRLRNVTRQWEEFTLKVEGGSH